MEDIFNSTILCNKCSSETIDTTVFKDGFELRAKKCPNCNKISYHPVDLEEYNNFNKLRSKQFQVKLRLVGNSYAVSIPKEIILFHEEINREIDKLIRLSLEEPGRISLSFNKVRRF
ncbi:MAG: hypothetical protein AABW46_04140 [Nanoarchaeota archaeon]